jgi:putative NADPH-quinone reductase
MLPAERQRVTKRITIIQGHPDARGQHFGNALANAYADGAAAAGHEVKFIEVAKLDFPLLRNSEEFYRGATPEAIIGAQADMSWADHLAIFYPLWHGHFPALLHGFLEQTFRPGFSIQIVSGQMPKKLFKGKTARIVVTMGMPALAYRWFFQAHSLKSLKRNILGFSGLGPIETTLIGLLGGGAGEPENAFPALMNAAKRERWLDKMRALGRQGR